MLFHYVLMQISDNMCVREPVKDKDKAAANGLGVCSEAYYYGHPD